jgi:hypothetical protein
MERSDWIGLSCAVGCLWFAFVADVALLAVFRGNHPESLHAFATICYLAVLFGAPVAALICGGCVLASQKKRGELIPRFALRFCIAAWVLFGIELVFVIAVMCYAIIVR